MRCSDRLSLKRELGRLPSDRVALGDLRRQWSSLSTGASPAALTNIELVAHVRRMVQARTIDAALLYDNATEIRDVDLAQLRQRVVHLPCAEGTLLIGPHDAFSMGQLKMSDAGRATAILTRLGRTSTGLAPLQSHWASLTPGHGVKTMSPMALAQEAGAAIRSGRLKAPLLAGPTGSRAAAARPDAPRPVDTWTSAEKIGEAIARSRHHLSGEVLAMVEQLLDPVNLAAMAAIALVLAGVQFLGPAGAAIDTAIMLLAWSIAGYQGVKGVVAFVEATAKVMTARTSDDIDACAKAYAHAFVAIGVVLLARMLARAKMRRPQQRQPSGGSPAAKPAAAKPTEAASKPVAAKPKQSLREQYLGRTPGKGSRTGREVIARMRADKKIDTALDGTTIFQAPNDNWYPLSEADMAHKVDAVRWWNDGGNMFGAKSDEAREMMLNSKNYVLDHFSTNRSAGAILGKTTRYLPPGN